MRLPHLLPFFVPAFTLLPALEAQKLKVYILAGQSNMQGHAKISTFDYIGDDPKTAPWLADMRDKDGKPTVCENVWISYLTGGRGGDGTDHGKLSAGWGARGNATQPGDKIGPEFTFGLRMQKAHKGPVLIIKTAWGGKSINTDFRPPSAGPYRFHPKTAEKLKQQGKLEKSVADRNAKVGVFYRKMIAHVQSVLKDPKKVCPAYDADKGYEIAGFAWFQGWNDMVDRGTYPDRGKPGGYGQYSTCMAHFIRDVRKDLGAPKMPFVIGVMGVNGKLVKEGNRYYPIHQGFRDAMAQPASLPEFEGNVVAVQTAPYWDERLAAIEKKMGKVKQMGRLLRTKNKKGPNADGKMNKAAQKDYLDKYRLEVVGEKDLAALKRGKSNAGFHYLGCAKTMAGIGYAFADALLGMGK